MHQLAQRVILAGLLFCVLFSAASAAEREDVRKVINLVTSVKMPYPENLTRNRAKTERVWLEREGATTGCIHIDERRWCYEHIPPIGNRAEMLRIRNEPARGVYIGAMYYYRASCKTPLHRTSEWRAEGRAWPPCQYNSQYAGVAPQSFDARPTHLRRVWLWAWPRTDNLVRVAAAQPT